MALVPPAQGDEFSVHLRTNHGLRCAQRLRVRWQPPPLFFRFTAIVKFRHRHETVLPKIASASVCFPYGARTESGGGCHTHSKAASAAP